MKKKVLFVVGACLLTLTGCMKVPKLQDGKEVVASIDGFNVTAEDLYAELKDQYGTSIIINKIDTAIADAEVTDETDAEEYAKKQIEAIKAQYEMYNLNFEDALKQAGYEDEKALKEAIVADYKKDLVLTNYVESQVSDDEINKYYKDEIYGEMTVRHILIKPSVTDEMTDEEKKAAEDKAYEKAKDIIKQLDEGADFSTLAKENSDDSGTAAEGGLLSNFTKSGVVSEFFNASLKLNDNEYTKEPVKTTYGYHVILKVSQNEKPSLDTVVASIRETLAKEKLDSDQNLSITAWDEIRKKHNMAINDSAIKKNYDEVIDSYKK